MMSKRAACSGLDAAHHELGKDEKIASALDRALDIGQPKLDLVVADLAGGGRVVGETRPLHRSGSTDLIGAGKHFYFDFVQPGVAKQSVQPPSDSRLLERDRRGRGD